MTRTFGTLLLGAAFFALLAPSRRRGTQSVRRQPVPTNGPRTFYALVQTRPRVVVLALSDNPDELAKEMAELDQTWNHWDLRAERQRYEIQPVPVLVASSVPALAG